MNFLKTFSVAAIAMGVLYVQALEPYTVEPPEEVAYYRVLEQSDVRPTDVAMLLTRSDSREEVSNIAQDYASKHTDAAAVSIRIVDEDQRTIARAYYCFDIAGAGTTGLSPGERMFEYKDEIGKSDPPLMG